MSKANESLAAMAVDATVAPAGAMKKERVSMRRADWLPLVPLAVAWLLSQTALVPFHFTYLYWMALPAGSDTVPLHGTLAPEPWMVSAKPEPGAQAPRPATLPTTRRFWPKVVLALAMVKVTAQLPVPPMTRWPV